MKAQALTLARAGFRVFPLRARDKKPLPNFPWKDLASNDNGTVANWWDQHPDANIGLATGGRFFVVDVDSPEGWRDLLNANGGELPPCPTVRTGKGTHLYFAMPDGLELGNRAGLGGGAFDVRGNGGYVVAPPSIHPDGRRYQWVTVANLANLPAPPPWLLELLTARKESKPAVTPTPPSARMDKYVAAALAGVAADVSTAPEGQRNATLYTKARRLYSFVHAGRLSKAVATAALNDAAHSAGLPSGEIAETLASAHKAAAQAPDNIEPANDNAPVRNEQRREQQKVENARLQQPDGSPLPPSMSVQQMEQDCVWIAEGSMVGRISDPQQVLSFPDFAGLTASSVTAIEGEKGKSKSIPNAVLWKQSGLRKTVTTRTFQAGAGAICRDPDNKLALNSWRRIQRRPAAADIGPFLEQVAYLFPDPNEREVFLNWLAHLEQRPGELPHYGWLHIAANTGTGRNWLASVLSRVWRGYVAPNVDLPSLLDSQYNGQLAGRVLAIVDEVQEAAGENPYRHTNRLKSLVNAEYRDLNPKFGRQYREHNACRWLVFSNHDNALPLNDTDRRWRVVRHNAAPRSPCDYAALYAHLADPEFINAVGVFLAERDISGFNPGERPPMSDAKRAALAASKTMIQQYAQQLVTHWPADVLTNADAGQVLSEGAETKFTPAMRRALEELGCVSIAKTLKVQGQVHRCWIVRNHTQWLASDSASLAKEASRARAGHMPAVGATAILADANDDSLETQPY